VQWSGASYQRPLPGRHSLPHRPFESYALAVLHQPGQIRITVTYHQSVPDFQ
jgi:hypothetical protein